MSGETERETDRKREQNIWTKEIDIFFWGDYLLYG